jgi:amidase
MIPLDIGTDMSGSIRMPAHYCGVFGLKPTESRVPQVGLVVLPRFDLPRIDRGLGVSGPLARTIDDLALALALLAGPHPADPSTPPVPVRPPRSRAASELRVALCPQIEGIVCSAEQRRRLERLGDDLRAAGATVVEGGLPFEFEELLAAYRRQMRAPLEVMAGHGAGPPGSEALLTSPLSVRDLYETWDVRDALIARFESFLEEFDTFMTPTTPDAAFVHRPRGEPIPVDGALVSSQVIDHPCLLATFTGCPALVVPIGLSESGLPIGAQLHARRWHDEALLDVGAAVAEVVGPLPAPP